MKVKNNQLAVRDISTLIGKLPPQAIDLEEVVLGAMMLEAKSASLVVDILSEEDFYDPRHQEIFSMIIDLYKKDAPIDMRTVVARLRKNGKLELVGGAYYIAELTSKVSSAANLEYHARVLVEHSIKRSLIGIASKVHHHAYDDNKDCFELLDETQRDIEGVGVKSLKGSFKDAFVLANNCLSELYERTKKKGLTGVPTGYTSLDRSLAGWQKSDLIIIAARPGMGKSAFVGSAAENAALMFDIPVGIFSLEMTAGQFMNRMIASQAEVDIHQITKGRVDEHELRKYGDAVTKIRKAPIYIDDTPALSILDLRARARRMKTDKKVQLIVVDYLQLMQGDKGGNREQEISSITRGLKRMAKDLDVPVIALSQLSRSVETRGGDKRPMLSDLRESGSIEQDADIVTFLYRPEYYKIEQDDEGKSTANVMEVIIAKHRHGSLDTVPLKFIGKHMKITDWDAPPGNFRSIEVRKPYADDKESLGGDDLPF